MNTAVSPHAGVGAIVYATNVTYAGFWLRVVAYIIDSLIVSLAMLILLVPLFFLMGGAAILGSLGHDLGNQPNPFAIGALLSLGLVIGGVALIGTSPIWRAARNRQPGANKFSGCM